MSVNTADVGDFVRKFDADADPQTVFFLMPVGVSGQDANCASENFAPLLKTLSLWTVQIEQTVREKLQTPPDEHGTVQASWDRSSFRSKLLESVMKSTPW